MERSRNSSNRLAELDSLRGLAALTVVASHYTSYCDRYLAQPAFLIPSFFGYYAVNVFFVISGFVIFMTLERCRSVPEFAVLRFSRLYPVYWSSLLLVLLTGCLLFDHDFWALGFLANMTMFQQFFGIGHIDNVYWSLTVELAFYFHAAWILRFGAQRHVGKILLGWLILSCAWAIIAPHETMQPDQRGILALLFAFDFSPFFSMGIIFYLIFKRGWTLQSSGLLALATFTEFWINGWSGFYVAIIVNILFIAMLFGKLQWLINPAFAWLGSISYSLYLTHRNLGYQVLSWLTEHEVSIDMALVITTAGALALATFFTLLIEKPALSRIRRIYQNAEKSK